MFLNFEKVASHPPGYYQLKSKARVWMILKWMTNWHQNFSTMSLSDAIWSWWSWSTLAQLMAWCHQAPSHYLNQWWLIALWGSVSFFSVQFHLNCSRCHIHEMSLEIAFYNYKVFICHFLFLFYKSIYSVQKQKQEHKIERKCKHCTQHKQ